MIYTAESVFSVVCALSVMNDKLNNNFVVCTFNVKKSILAVRVGGSRSETTPSVHLRLMRILFRVSYLLSDFEFN